ncbi:flagellar protein FlaG [Pseudomonas sp. v388]|uniref:flagellar protein FlaG n=1 Tax=Pseudomonas sp. v388 TaxID=2479849 RepID=UPI0015A7FDF4|nr:flagellar protein FlaG [Pseudomonas sp. v388]
MDMSVKLNVSYPAAQSAAQSATPATSEQPVDKPVAERPVAAPTESNGSGLKKEDAQEEAKVKAAAEDIQKFFHSVKRNLEFSIDEASGKVIVKVIASDSGEIVRQIPNAEILKLAESLSDANSLLFHARA